METSYVTGLASSCAMTFVECLTSSVSDSLSPSSCACPCYGCESCSSSVGFEICGGDCVTFALDWAYALDFVTSS